MASRIVTAADYYPNLHSNGDHTAEQRAQLSCWRYCLSSFHFGCWQRTPTYAGPPDTVLSVVMKKWAITPDRVVVRQGAHVEMVVSTTDVEHGIAVPGLGINEPGAAGQAGRGCPRQDLRGTYPNALQHPLRTRPRSMTGVIVITPDAKVAVHK